MVLVPGTVVVVAASCESVSKKGVLLAIQDNYHTYVMMMNNIDDDVFLVDENLFYCTTTVCPSSSSFIIYHAVLYCTVCMVQYDTVALQQYHTIPYHTILNYSMSYVIKDPTTTRVL